MVQAPPSEASASTLAALSELEETLGITPIIRSDASDASRDAALLALFGRRPDGLPTALPSPELVARAAAPIAGTSDEARALARAQRQRGSLAWALATARGASVPDAATFGASSFARFAEDPDQLPAAWRTLALLIESLLADREGRDPMPSLDRLLERKDLRPAERTLARARRAALDTVHGAAADRTLDSLQATAARSSTIELLLVTEVRALRLQRAGRGDRLAEDAAFDGALRAAATPAQAVEMRSYLLMRLRLDPSAMQAIDERGSDLRLLANADHARDRDAAKLIDRLQRSIAAIDAGEGLAPLAPALLFELGRTLSVAGRFDEAFAPFARLVTDHPRDPLCGPAADLAIVIGIDRHRRAPDAQSRTTLADLLGRAIDACPDHPERQAWLAAACELDCEARDPAAALGFASLMDPAHPRFAAMRVLVTRTALDESVELNDVERAAIALRALDPLVGTDGASPTALLRNADAATHAWVDALLARRALLDADGNGGNGGRVTDAKERAIACIMRDDAPADDLIDARAHALVTLVEALRRSGAGPDLARPVAAAIERDAARWRRALRVELDGAIDRLASPTIDTDAPRPADRDAALLAAVAPSLVTDLRADGPRRLALAQALIAAGRPELVERVFPPLEADSDTIDALLLRGDAMRRRNTPGSRGDAMRVFGTVAARAPERSEAWWRAELGQLRTTAASGTDEAIVAVRARIHWLRGIDRTLGGERTGPAIESLLRSLPERGSSPDGGTGGAAR